MSPAYKTNSRNLFSAAAAMVLGLQFAPWPLSLTSQEKANEPTIVQVEAESSENLSRREQRKLHKTRRSAPQAETQEPTEPLTTQQLQMQLQQMQLQMQLMQPQQQMQPQQMQPVKLACCRVGCHSTLVDQRRATRGGGDGLIPPGYAVTGAP